MISVIIPVYKSSQTLKECLDAVFSSSHQEFEVIVVSDNSPDDSVAIAKKYQCEIIELPQNKGPSFARNKGAQAAKGKILFFIDSDVVIKKDAIDYLNNKFSSNEVNAIQGIYSHDLTYSNIATQYQQSFYCYYTWQKNKMYTSTLVTNCFAIRKNIFNQLKGFNTNIKNATCEDEEFGYTLVDNGYEILISRELNVEHRVNYSIAQFIKRNFKMYIETMKSYLRNKTYVKKTQQTNYLKVLMGIPLIGLITLVLFLIIFYPNNINWYAFFILNIIFLLLNSGFINFVRQTKGLLKALGIVLICYLDIFLMLLGIIYGSLNYFIGRKY